MFIIATLNNNSRPICSCPHCDSASITRSGFDRGTQRYRCKSCNRTFKATTGTPVHGLHNKEKIASYLRALRKGMSVRAAAKYTGVSTNTSFAWRHKFLSSLETCSEVRSINEISSAEIIQLEYSAKGRRKPPEKHTSPTKTIALLSDGQLELHKLPAVRPVRKAVSIFSESTAKFFATAANKTITAAIKHSENAIRITNRQISTAMIAGIKQQVVTLLSWMERFSGVASKYLQNYWNWYASLLNLGKLKQETEYFCKMCTSRRSLAQYSFTKDL